MNKNPSWINVFRQPYLNANTKGMALYNLGFVMTSCDPLGLVEILAILSIESQVFRLSTSESPPICYDLANVSFAMNSPSFSQFLSYIKSAKD